MQNQLYAPILQRLQLPDMMQTGEESSVQWDIPVHSLIRKRWICSLKVRLESFRLLKMVWQLDYSEEEATKILSEPEK